MRTHSCAHMRERSGVKTRSAHVADCIAKKCDESRRLSDVTLAIDLQFRRTRTNKRVASAHDSKDIVSFLDTIVPRELTAEAEDEGLVNVKVEDDGLGLSSDD
jgi:hypothetical protein